MRKLVILVIVATLIYAANADDDDKKKGGKNADDDDKKTKGGKAAEWSKTGKMEFKWKCRGKDVKGEFNKASVECPSKCRYEDMGAVKNGKLDVDAVVKALEKSLPEEVHEDGKKELKACADEAEEGKTYFTTFSVCHMKAIQKVCKVEKKKSKKESKDDDEE